MASPTHKWTMIIGMDKCTGCGACRVACHAKNNVPSYTDEDTARGRAMHWMCIENYWGSQYPDPKAYFLPGLCQQYFQAPCEPVCPVFATLHGEIENVNLKVYNSCVGTHYCQNNDSYKARFFNFFDPVFSEPLNQQLNPDVTIRTAGIMEKRTFCIQRIRRVEEQALVEKRELASGEVQPAYVQTCPPGALVFGDLNNPNSERFIETNSFRLLEHLGIESAIYYLKGGKSDVN